MNIIKKTFNTNEIINPHKILQTTKVQKKGNPVVLGKFLIKINNYKLINFSNKSDFLLPKKMKDVIKPFMFLTLKKNHNNNILYTSIMSKSVYKIYITHMLNYIKNSQIIKIPGYTLHKKNISGIRSGFLVGINGLITPLYPHELLHKKFKSFKEWRNFFIFFKHKRLNFFNKIINLSLLKINISRSRPFIIK